MCSLPSGPQGKKFYLLSIGLQQFDHSRTKFNLLHHQINFDLQPLGCKTCHTDLSHKPGEVLCTDCHLAHDAIYMTDHLKNFGPDCLACHDGTGSMAGFDHDAVTGFPLAGEHAAVACSECHRIDQITDISTVCAVCHDEPDQHRGVFDPSCETCHSPDGWSPASFENEFFSHWTSTGFSLENHFVDYADLAMNCKTCHQDQD